MTPEGRPIVKRDPFDLNDVTPRGGRPTEYDWSRRRRDTRSGTTVVHFGDLLDALVEFIRGSEEIVGCVAWLSSDYVIDALAQRPVALVLNKEWILRSSDTSRLGVRQRERLERLNGGITADRLPSPISDIAPAGTTLEAVRCTGHSPRVKAKNSPLMHHKFIVRLSAGVPVAVWTGSFNFTANASSSLENAVEIHDPGVAQAYLEEFSRVAAISEPMEFAAGKSDPNWSPRKTADGEPVRKPGAGTVKKASPRKTSTTKKAATTTRAAAAKKTTATAKTTKTRKTSTTKKAATTTRKPTVTRTAAKKPTTRATSTAKRAAPAKPKSAPRRTS